MRQGHRDQRIADHRIGDQLGRQQQRHGLMQSQIEAAACLGGSSAIGVDMAACHYLRQQGPGVR
jgi:hypothetical protein